MVHILDNMKNGKAYDGNTVKFGISLNNYDYIVKFPKEPLSIYCEYIASRFIKRLGILCHDVYLGDYKVGKDYIIVDVIKDFTSGTSLTLHSFKDTKQSSEDTDVEDKEYTYHDVLYLIDKHLKMTDSYKAEAKNMFWDMFICDSILANRDRHWGNWGYLSNGRYYRFAPLYDNGSCLFPNVDNMIYQYENSKTRKRFLYERIFVFPASLFKMKRHDGIKKTNFYEMYKDLRINKVFASRVKLIKDKFTSKDIFNIMCDICLNDKDLYNLEYKYKRFYIEIVTLRYKCIILREPLDKAYNEVENWFKGMCI